MRIVTYIESEGTKLLFCYQAVDCDSILVSIPLTLWLELRILVVGCSSSSK